MTKPRRAKGSRPRISRGGYETVCRPCGMSFGAGVRRVGDICHSSVDFPNVYTMSFGEWYHKHRTRIRNEYYEECANFCRRPVEKV